MAVGQERLRATPVALLPAALLPGHGTASAGTHCPANEVLETDMANYDLDRRDYRSVDRRTAAGGDVVRILWAILLPPLGMFLQVGLGLQFWLNILLTIFGYVPGIIHAVWIILRR
jgi:uncharacterized membrane protein YqaE (UPF0057 family)